jgi:hypothetical protein
VDSPGRAGELAAVVGGAAPMLLLGGLCSTLAVALVVGTVLFAINDLDVVLAGGATSRVWLKAALTYPVPFMVANYGLLVGAHRTEPGREQAALSARLLVMRRKRRGQGD